MVQQPGAWTDAEVSFTQPANGVSYDEHNTGEIAITTSDPALVSTSAKRVSTRTIRRCSTRIALAVEASFRSMSA
jgi:hypothetical protein